MPFLTLHQGQAQDPLVSPTQSIKIESTPKHASFPIFPCPVPPMKTIIKPLGKLFSYFLYIQNNPGDDAGICGLLLGTLIIDSSIQNRCTLPVLETLSTFLLTTLRMKSVLFGVSCRDGDVWTQYLNTISKPVFQS